VLAIADCPSRKRIRDRSDNEVDDTRNKLPWLFQTKQSGCTALESKRWSAGLIMLPSWAGSLSARSRNADSSDSQRAVTHATVETWVNGAEILDPLQDLPARYVYAVRAIHPVACGNFRDGLQFRDEISRYNIIINNEL
jgi:hypothetical protein